MSDRQARVVDWLDDVLAWLREPMTLMPVAWVLQRLRIAFDVNVCSWTSQQGTVLREIIFDPPGAMVSEAATLAEFQTGLYRDCHPLSAWYERTPSTDPQTSARVPDGIVTSARRMVIEGPLIRLGFEQQMAIYYRRQRTGGCFFVIARDRRDFDTDDLAVAHYVQRSLVTLDRQTRTLQGRDKRRPVVDLGLTGRELAVLQLVSDGLSTRLTARRLACSPRTVEKHLQHAYRKLGVRDRINAIRVARLPGVVDRQTAL